ncbi:MAG: cyclic nucleotide-binding domain-containing protein [Mariprofundaceae bacterium]
MAIRLKVARSPEELEDAYRLRYYVYVVEGGKFAEQRFPDGRVLDAFDGMPYVANIVAYTGAEAVGTLRINLDSGQGLPPDEFYDFSDFRRKIVDSWSEKHGAPPLIGSVSMLAVKRSWRHRRDVIRAMFKLGTGVGHSWNGTHIIAAVASKTAGMYEKIGFEYFDQKQWIEDIGDHILPMACKFSSFHNWAFGDLVDSLKTLDFFSNRFQRLILAADEVVFRQGDEHGEAYIVDTGAIRISKCGTFGDELTLATLGHGQLFGELSLIDTQPRSAQATTLVMTELIALDREDFFSELEAQPHRVRDVLGIFSERLRRADELAFILAHGSSDERIAHALSDIRKLALPDDKRPGTKVAKIAPTELARQAGVSEADVLAYLKVKNEAQQLEYNARRIRFLNGA